jgi:hypothetical protein
LQNHPSVAASGWVVPHADLGILLTQLDGWSQT